MLNRGRNIEKGRVITRRMFILAAAKILLFAGISSRLYNLQISDREKYEILSDKKTQYFYQKNIGSIQQVLFESKTNDSYIYGFSENYIKIKSRYSNNLENSLQKISINNIEYGHTNYAIGTLIN